MVLTIGFAWHVRTAAEIKIFSPRLAFWPRAHAWTERVEINYFCGSRFSPYGRPTFRQAETMNLTDYRILRYTEALANNTGRKAIVPKRNQCANTFWCPLFTHFVSISYRRLRFSDGSKPHHEKLLFARIQCSHNVILSYNILYLWSPLSKYTIPWV